MKKIMIILSLCTTIHAEQFLHWGIVTSPDKQAYIIAMPALSENLTPAQMWNCFSFCSLDLPLILARAHTENKKLFLFVPDQYHQVKTTDPNAPLTEGARVAMAWVSIYYRFYNVDSYIIPYASPHAAHLPAVCNALLTRTPTEKETIYQRLQPFDSSLNTNQSDDIWFFMNTRLKTIAPEQTHISSSLPTKQPNQKRILITGGAGFIGSHLTQRFLADGHQVIVLDNFSCCTQEHIKAISNPNLYWQAYDVSNPFHVDEALDMVIHLASRPSPVDYYQNPIDTMRSGLHGTHNALEVARQHNARFVMGSTSEVYGDPELHPQPESYAGNVDPIGKRSQYDQSKRGAETWCKYYFDTYQLDIRIVRIFNTYGPRMRLGDGRVVTNFIKAALENSEITIYGSGNQTRSFGYVSDTVDALYRVAQSEKMSSFDSLENRIFNIGNSGEFTINEVAQRVNELSQNHLTRSTAIIHIPQFDATDPKVRCPDLTHVHEVTHYKPSVDFANGLEKTFLYFQSRTK